MSQQPKPPSEQITLRSSFNLLYVIATVHARCVQPFMRDQIGAKAQGWYSLAAGILMFYSAGAMEDEFFMYYFAAWLVASLGQRWAPKKNHVHSQYTGRPALVRLLVPFVTEGTARLVVEPLICLGAGVFLAQWSMTVGKLVGLAGGSLMLIERLDRRIQENREQAVVDARLEAEQTASGVRDRFGY